MLTFLLLALAAAGPPPPLVPLTVYRLHPSIDAPVIAGTALAITVPTLLAEDIIRKRCPCDPSEINGFDRGAVGNHNGFADVTSDVTAVPAMTAPPLLDFLDIGAGDAFHADAVIFAETLLVMGRSSRSRSMRYSVLCREHTPEMLPSSTRQAAIDPSTLDTPRPYLLL